VPVPRHSPPQPAKFQPVSGVAVRVTTVPARKVAEQLSPQEMPVGVLLTVPFPNRVTVRIKSVLWEVISFSTLWIFLSSSRRVSSLPARSEPVAGGEGLPAAGGAVVEGGGAPPPPPQDVNISGKGKTTARNPIAQRARKEGRNALQTFLIIFFIPPLIF